MKVIERRKKQWIVSSTILNRCPETEKKMLFKPIGLKKCLTIHGIVDSGAYVTANSPIGINKIKQQAPPVSSKLITCPIFQYTEQTASNRNR